MSTVQTFNWNYSDPKTKKTVHITDLQAILINPKWADHSYKFAHLFDPDHKTASILSDSTANAPSKPTNKGKNKQMNLK